MAVAVATITIVAVNTNQTYIYSSHASKQPIQTITPTTAAIINQ
jgi:hypothetical protein